MLGMGILGVGIFFVVIATVGVIRMPTFYHRVHAAGIVDSVGMALVLVGLAMQYGLSMFTLKIMVLCGLLLVTNIAMCNILTNAACSVKSDDRSDI
ncbi:monovalent cation/H(+) antiporter subunit G [Candidatus Anaplasma sp. TIGMIC]|uniref:monovalent cation/H(+) antiporter subunit G n=1 Tax=Candidatus Anaplasma sp. TIGMIC TaxID=3020713 RepID=UPI00232A9F51|nr:monovalent cation/H(+) antiporter subunit G [Candidatus Anaplasma sp. TIGMIC]MDB1135023.1 monovalent cation/H(+) antiporter subunit G [Candidatus Anaplasma sp. TIGMIC]